MGFLKKLDTKDIQLAMEEAEHNFTVEKANLFTDDGLQIPDKVAVISKKGYHKYLGTVGRNWEPVQPETIYELVQELLNNTDGKINGSYTLYNGSVIGVLINLATKEYISNDPVELNFMMMTSFNGTHAVSGYATTNRIVCTNQCNTSNAFYNLRHTRNVFNRIDIIKNMLKFYNNEIRNFDSKMMQMVQYHMDNDKAVKWFQTLFPKPKTDRSKHALENQLSIFVECLNNGMGTNIPGVRGTCYGVFQALTEYVNHKRSTRIHNDRDPEEVMFDSVHFGSGNRIIQNGMRLLMDRFEFKKEDFLID